MAPAWQDAGIQSLPGSIELRTTRLRRGAPESASEKCSGRRNPRAADFPPSIASARCALESASEKCRLGDGRSTQLDLGIWEKGVFSSSVCERKEENFFFF